MDKSLQQLRYQQIRCTVTVTRWIFIVFQFTELVINTNCDKFQEAQNRPISGSDFCYDIPLKTAYPLKTISGSQETFKEDDDNQFPDDQNEE